MGKWKKKWKPALWVKVFGKEEPQPARKSYSTLNAVSNSMRLMLATYREKKKVWWRKSANQCCRKCGRKMTVRNRTVHHSHGRIGNLLLYELWWIPLCIMCHRWVDSNPNEARELGLLCDLGQWNVQPVRKHET